MKHRRQYGRDREQFTRKSEELMRGRLRGMQDRLYSVMIDIVAGLATDQAGRLLFNVRNVQRAGRVSSAVASFNRDENRSFLGWMFGKMLSLFGVNRKYFSSFQDPSAGIDDAVRRLTMLRYGYDTQSDSIVPGGYLSQLASSQGLALNIAQLINSAIEARTPLNEFRSNFRRQFVSPGGLGMVEHHYLRFTHDLFQEFDRSVQNEYANRLGLNHAIYSGTIKDNTRPFCRARANNIYTREEIESWNSQDWKGKKPGVPVTIALGGYNCRHHLSWISDELAERMNRPINEYS